MPGARFGRGTGEDPFERLVLGDDFVRGATVQEASAAERIEHLQRIDLEHRRTLEERHAAHRAAARRARRARRVRRAVLTVVVAVAAAVGAWSLLPSDEAGLDLRDPGPAPVGSARMPAVPAGAPGDDQIAAPTDARTRPSPSSEAGTAPLGTPAPLPAESTAYRFTMLQPGRTDPVAYDPCRPVHLVVNGRTAPPGGGEILADALDEVSRVTGLQLVVDGPSDEPADFDRAAFQPERYGDRWAPVLVAWSDPEEMPDLDGDVAGVGGSSWLEVDRRRLYVTGLVVIDGPQMAELLAAPGGGEAVRAVLLHELGHLVGLDHVDDPGQLMQPVAQPDVVAFGPGDLTGLAHLGRGACHPDL